MSDLLATSLGARRPPPPADLAKAHRRARVAMVAVAADLVVFLVWVAWYVVAPPQGAVAVDGLRVAVTLLSFALFVWWKLAAYRLVPPLTGALADRTPVWAVIGYIVPILNFWVPYQIMSEIQDSVAPESSAGPFEERPRQPIPLPLWWGLYLGSALLGSVLNLMAGSDAPQVLLSLSLLFVAMSVGSNVVTILLVRALDAGQQAAAAHLEALGAAEARVAPAGLR